MSFTNAKNGADRLFSYTRIGSQNLTVLDNNNNYLYEFPKSSPADAEGDIPVFYPNGTSALVKLPAGITDPVANLNVQNLNIVDGTDTKLYNLPTVAPSSEVDGQAIVLTTGGSYLKPYVTEAYVNGCLNSVNGGSVQNQTVGSNTSATVNWHNTAFRELNFAPVVNNTFVPVNAGTYLINFSQYAQFLGPNPSPATNNWRLNINSSPYLSVGYWSYPTNDNNSVISFSGVFTCDALDDITIVCTNGDTTGRDVILGAGSISIVRIA